MPMSIQKDLQELVKAGVIPETTAQNIRYYYAHKENHSGNRLFIIFGILGALLTGLGIILIIAHNWDDLSRPVKTGFAFLPLLSGQLACTFTLLKRKDQAAWRESSSTFLFLAIGAAISLISQIYHIPGDMGEFTLSWMLLCLPLIYLMRSSITSLLYLTGITYYVFYTGYYTYPKVIPYTYWLLLLSALPHYYMLYKERPGSNFTTFHHWFVPASIAVALGTVTRSSGQMMLVAYMSLWGLYYLTGQLGFFRNRSTVTNGYRIIGSLGTVIMLLVLSFDRTWIHLRTETFELGKTVNSPEFLAAAITTLLAGYLLYKHLQDRTIMGMKPMAPVFILFIIAFIIGHFSALSVILINIFILLTGLLTIREGARQDHLGVLNYGLLIITALTICRFFDTELSFVFRGILFVSVGAGFFASNYWMLKKRKNEE